MRFSIIIPVYNVDKYLDKCLKSLKDQIYQNFEVIIVNDGTKDNSQTIIDQYVLEDERFHGYQKENGGLSSARNYGVKKATGDYILFIDGDDYVSSDYLKCIEEAIMIDQKPDIVRFQVCKVIENTGETEQLLGATFSNLSGIDAFKRFSSDTYFVPAWLYAYRTEFWNQYQFQYEEKDYCYHEDYGLTPYVVLCAKTVSAIPDAIYNYIIRDGSIMTSQDTSKLVKKANDTLYLYDNLMVQVKNMDILSDDDKKYVMSYLTNAIFIKGKYLPEKELKEFIKKLKSRNVFQYLMDDTISRKVKKHFVKYHLKFYIQKMSK